MTQLYSSPPLSAPLAAAALALLFVALPLSPRVHAQETVAGDCFTQWKGADANRNGVLDFDEPGAATGKTVTRDQFLADCLKRRDARISETPGKPSQPGLFDDFPKDLGKGDLTKGKNRFTHEEARKRLEALGYKDIRDLELDANGIWRATALSTGERQAVGLDSQGDVVSK